MQALKEILETSPIGYNDKDPAQLLIPGMYLKAENALIDTARIKKRYGTSVLGTSLGNYSILGLTPYEPIAGSKYVIACLDGASNAQLYSWAGTGNFAGIGSANLTKGAKMNFAQAANVLYGFNGTDVVSVDSSLTVTKNPASVPQGTYGAWFHNYLFVANTTSYPSRLYWSNLGVPGTFSGTDYLDVSPNDGDYITGMIGFNDELYVFKQNTIWTITGWSGATFSTTTAAAQNLNSRLYGYGSVANGSLVVIGKDLYYLSFSGSIPHFRSLVQTSFASTLQGGIVSEDIEGTMNGLSKTSLSNTAGIFDGKYVYFSVTNGGSSSNNLVLVLEPSIKYKGHRSWSTWTSVKAAQFCSSRVSGRDTIYFGDATTGGYVYKIDTSLYSDNGTAVSLDVRTRDFMFDGARKTHYKYLYVKYLSGNTGTLDVNARIDQAVDYATQSALSQQGNSPGLGPTGAFTLGTSVLGGSPVSKTRVNLKQLTGTTCGIQFTEGTANACEIYDYQLMGVPKGLRAN